MGIFPNASVLRVSYGIQLLFILFAVKQYFSCEEIPEEGDSRCDQFCDDLEQRCLVGKQLFKQLRDADRDQQTDNTDRRQSNTGKTGSAYSRYPRQTAISVLLFCRSPEPLSARHSC